MVWDRIQVRRNPLRIARFLRLRIVTIEGGHSQGQLLAQLLGRMTRQD